MTSSLMIFPIGYDSAIKGHVANIPNRSGVTDQLQALEDPIMIVHWVDLYVTLESKRSSVHTEIDEGIYFNLILKSPSCIAFRIFNVIFC